MLACGVDPRRAAIVEPCLRELGFEEEADPAAIVRPKLGGECPTVGEAEIDQAHAPIVQDQCVTRVDIAMQHASGVDRGICIEQTADELECARSLATRNQRMPGACDIASVLPLDGEVRTLADLAHSDQSR